VRGLRSAARRLVPIPLLALVFAGGCVESLEKRFIFFPDRTVAETPRDWGLPYEDVYFTTEDGVRLNGWWVPGTGSPFTVLWFHGNAGNISHRLDSLKLRRDYLGVNFFIFDYREYGRSEGRVSEEGTYRDGTAAVRYLRGRPGLDPNRIVCFGESLGSAVAVEVALRNGCAGLILESPFLSVAEMAKVAFPFLPVGRFLQTKYDTLAKIGQVNVPVLVVHGVNDEIVPFQQGRRLFEAAREPKEFHAVRGARHNDIFIIGGDAYLEAMARFMGRLDALRSP
jgi:fermentation-respiration switch protein FrsA (DUF1100 family)